ncbi:MAG: two component transcriptional regulator, LuxR family [Pseudonocardiales bacterium]|nr:two component transcriptional regulator, LuxR family [Pseudonocardiales bacterium]
MGQQFDVQVNDAVKTVIIVDDHHAFADLLALALANEADFEIVGRAASADAAVDLAVRTRPAMVVMDIRLGGRDGLEATRRIREVLPETIVAVISAHREPSWVAKAASAGASAFAPKAGSLTEMLSVLRRARNGSMVVAPSVFRHTATVAPPPLDDEPVEPLTHRERDVLDLMGKGVAPAQITRVLNLSIHTTRGHVKSIYAKLGAQSQLEAVVKAQRLGLIDSTQ